MMKSLSSALIVLCFIVALPGMAAAQCSAPPPWYPPDPLAMKGVEHYVVVVPQGASSSVLDRLPGTVCGKVVPRRSDGNPDTSGEIGGALITLHDGNATRETVSSCDGTFSFQGIPPGAYPLTIEARGYHQGRGQILVEGERARSVLVGLMPRFHQTETQKGYINIFAYGKENSAGKWMAVTSIRVHQRGNYSRRWSDSFGTYSGDSYKSLYCTGAPVGKYYTVEVLWSDGTCRTQSFCLSSKFRDISIYPY
ncbi:MAG: carboxypeptidase-like regulatory domain-containing protein [Candidatus Eremiobacteraeota bacterium]|nr:carboxypeptidase-like regulatory domain-containing protein [Candidatus Eremiobacteraeota bacterium]